MLLLIAFQLEKLEDVRAKTKKLQQENESLSFVVETKSRFERCAIFFPSYGLGLYYYWLCINVVHTCYHEYLKYFGDTTIASQEAHGQLCMDVSLDSWVKPT